MLSSLAFLVLGQTQRPLMSWGEYNRVEHHFPYALDIRKGKGHVVYFGFAHTHDANNRQFGQLRKLWLALKPEAVVNEDITPQASSTLEDSIMSDGERGALAFWATQERIPQWSIDMKWAVEASELSKSIPKSKIKMFYFVRGYLEDSMYRLTEKTSQDDVALNELYHLKSEGITWKPNTLAEVDSVWKSLGMKGSWRTPQPSWITPTGIGPLNIVSKKSSELRDKHMIGVIDQCLKDGKRVLVVVGATHVVMQEPALPGTISHLNIH